MTTNPPISIVTGFLGSGKTTLLRHLLHHGFGEQRVALIVNEIGEIGFDGHVMEGVNVERMIELTSGCICCSIGTDFLFAVEEIIETVAPDLIIVETTGLAEPSGLIRQIQAGGLLLDAIVTLVDAVNIEQELTISPVTDWQLQAGDFLVLNKCDLMDAAALDRVRQLLRQHNRRAALLETSYGQIDPRILFSGPRFEHSLGDSPPHNHLHGEQISTLLWQSDVPLVRTQFEAEMQALPDRIYRVKGHVYCTDEPWPSLVNGVCGRVQYEATRFRQSPSYLNQIVFIGRILEPLQAALFARLDGCADTPERTADWQARRG